MYASHFGLSQEPFSIAPDPRYLYMSERHREALAHLLYGVQAGGGFVLLTGEIGTGKTTVCRCFLEQMPADCRVAYIFNPRLTVLELLQTVLQEFGIDAPADAATVKPLVDALNDFLLREHAAGRRSLLIIDEAQALAPDVLEQLRLLTNLETAQTKLLQIVLIGQPELRAVLARPDMEQLAQRVIARFHLGSLTEAETAAYVAHRMQVAGQNGPLPFDAAALRRLHRLTHGVPRRINLLAGRALLGAYAQRRHAVDAATVGRAADEVFGATGAQAARPATPWPAPAAWPKSVWVAIGVLLAATAIGAALWQGRPERRGPVADPSATLQLRPAPALAQPPDAR